MLSKSRRIERKLFPLLLKGKTYKNNLFLLRFAVINGDHARFSFSVSKKVAKSAVIRNKIRRMGYHLLEKYLPQIQSNALAGFVFKKVPKNKDEVEENLKNILLESKLIKN